MTSYTKYFYSNDVIGNTYENLKRFPRYSDITANISLSLPANISTTHGYDSFYCNIDIHSNISIYDFRVLVLNMNTEQVSDNQMITLLNNVNMQDLNQFGNIEILNAKDINGALCNIEMTKTYYTLLDIMHGDNISSRVSQSIYIPDVVAPEILNISTIVTESNDVLLNANLYDHSNINWKFALLNSNISIYDANLDMFFNNYVSSNTVSKGFSNIHSNVSTFFMNIDSNVLSSLSSNSTYYAYLYLLDSVNNKTIYTQPIFIPNTNFELLLSYPLISDKLPIINTSYTDLSLSSLGGNYTSSNIHYRYEAKKIIGDESFENVLNRSALKLDNNYYAVSYGTQIAATELFDKDIGEKLWTGSINLHNSSHSFSTWIYISNIDTNTPSIGFNAPVISLYSAKFLEYLAIDGDGRPFLWYLAQNSSSQGYRIYKMDLQLITHKWYNITWTFKPSESDPTKIKIKGYVNGVLYTSYYTVGSSPDNAHFIAIGPDSDVDSFYYDSRNNSNSYLLFGTRFPANDYLPHTLYISDVNFYNQTLSLQQINQIYTKSSIYLLSDKTPSNNQISLTIDSTYNDVDYYCTLSNGDQVWSEDSGYGQSRSVSNLFDANVDSWNNGWQTSGFDTQSTFIYKFNSGPKTITSIKFTQPGSAYMSDNIVIKYGTNGSNDTFSNVDILSYPPNLSNMSYSDSRTLRISPVSTELLKVIVSPPSTNPPNGNNDRSGLWEVEMYGYQNSIPVTLGIYDSKTVFNGTATSLFYPRTNNSSDSFTNNSQILTHAHNGKWGNHTYQTTTDTPDGSNSMILKSQSYGYGVLNYPSGNSYNNTIAYWVKFDHDSDDPVMTAIISSSTNSGWGGSLFTIGNSNLAGRMINIQFQPSTGYLSVFVNGLTTAIKSITYKPIKYSANTWLLLSMSIQNTYVSVYVNGIKHFSFEIHQLLVDAYNQLYNTSYNQLSQTIWNGHDINITNIIIFLRDAIPTYFSFSLWKVYTFDRKLNDGEHLGLFENPI